jgi:hypothetical protein
MARGSDGYPQVDTVGLAGGGERPPRRALDLEAFTHDPDVVRDGALFLDVAEAAQVLAVVASGTARISLVLFVQTPHAADVRGSA